MINERSLSPRLDSLIMQGSSDLLVNPSRTNGRRKCRVWMAVIVAMISMERKL